MNTDEFLEDLRCVVQVDLAGRGLARCPGQDMLSACAGDFASACQRLAALKPGSRVGIFTGFYLPALAAAENDGPMGAVQLAHVLVRLGHRPVLFSDAHTIPALTLAVSHFGASVLVCDLANCQPWAPGLDDFSLLIAIERPGPAADGRVKTMRGDDATAQHAPAHLWFERCPVPTIGIGDGGNEIGMGKLPLETIAANIPLGSEIACRTATTDLLVVGVSNWGGYALAAGLLALDQRFDLANLLDPQRERRLWAQVLPAARLVHAASGRVELAVDGLDWATYIRPLMWMYARLVRR